MKKAKASWFRMKAANNVGEISILGDIGGFGISAQDFSDALDALGPVSGINIRINSDGGDVSTGFALYNMLALHPAPKTVTVMGLAASMASVVMMAGDKRVMPKNAVIMIHNPVGQVSGSSQEIIEFGKAVGDMRKSIATTYSDASGQPVATMLGLMDKQSWLGAAQCKAMGLCTDIAPAIEIAAKFDISRFANAPRSYGEIKPLQRALKGTTMSKPNDENEFEGPDAEATAAITKSVRESILAQQKQVGALCRIAGKPQLAAKFVEDDMTVDAVVTELDKLAKADAEAALKKGMNRKPGTAASLAAAEAGDDSHLNTHNRVGDEDGGNVIDPSKIWGNWNNAKKANAR